MVVYMLRHAIAEERGKAGYPNDDRPLTEVGRNKMSKEAKGISKIVGKVDVILTSPMIRAHDTAKIVARALGAESKIKVCKDLTPGHSLKKLLASLSKFKELKGIMVVGHQPDLGYLASALLGSSESIVEFKKGAICAIEISTLPPSANGRLLWLLQPKHVREFAPSRRSTHGQAV
jgi:phosphohistidine phosphatase